MHLYGFPSPDSDYDLRGVHLLPLKDVVGLTPGEETVEKSGIHDALEIDLVTHDAKKFFGMMLKKNGYVMEQLFSPLVVHSYARARGVEGHRRQVPDQASRPSLFRFRRDTMEAFPEGESAAREAAAVRLPGAVDRHSFDANWRNRGEPQPPQ